MKKLWDWVFIKTEFIRYALACVSGKKYFSLARLAVASEQMQAKQAFTDSFLNCVYGGSRTRKAARILAYGLAGFILIVLLLILIACYGR